MEKQTSQSPENPLVEITEFFNMRSSAYNAIHLELVDGGMEGKDIIASFLPERAKTIIDFGIGTGLELAAIFRRFPDIKVTGVDVASDMLNVLRESYPDKNITLHCGSYFDYDFGNCLYDAALSVMTLHHYRHHIKTGLYRRIFNCIKPGGMYIECDYMLSEHEYENPQEQEDFFFAEYERLKAEQGLNGGKEYHYDTPCAVANQIKMLAEAGFVNVKEVWRCGNTVILTASKQLTINN